MFSRCIENMTADQIANFLVVGGECNYLLRCETQAMTVKDGDGNDRVINKARLKPMYPEEWQADHLQGPKPAYWDQDEVKRLLDIAEQVMNLAAKELKLRARILRKERAIGLFPGGADMVKKVPVGHGSKKLKQESLDEVVLRILEAIRMQQVPISLPFCVFNGGTDAWLDIGNKSVGVAALQGYFGLQPAQCLHVGDQVRSSHNIGLVALYLLIIVNMILVFEHWQ
jgi:IMP and pyridine-specific 5'-nucleotidase